MVYFNMSGYVTITLKVTAFDTRIEGCAKSDLYSFNATILEEDEDFLVVRVRTRNYENKFVDARRKVVKSYIAFVDER